MKEISKLIRKPIFLLASAVAAALLISFGLINYLILPNFKSYEALSAKNSTDSDHLSLLTRNVASFENLDKSEIQDYSKIGGAFVPDQADALRFIVLNEIVATNSGVKVSNIDVGTTSQPKSVQQSAPVKPQSSKGLVGSAYAQTVPSQPAVAGNTGRSFTVKVSVVGTFDKIERYLMNLKKTDRLLGVSSISITSGTAGISALVSIKLPLGDTNITVAPEDSITLTQKDKEFLDDLFSKVVFTAQPTLNPLGQIDPFAGH